jgi:hypothetical protein
MYKIEQRSPVGCRMMVVGIVPDPKGLALRTFECRKRDHSFASTVASDTMNAVLAGWITGELNPPIQARSLERALRWEIAPGSRFRPETTSFAESASGTFESEEQRRRCPLTGAKRASSAIALTAKRARRNTKNEPDGALVMCSCSP